MNYTTLCRFGRILLFICNILQFIWSRDFHLHRTYLWKLFRLLIYILDWLYLIQWLTSFSYIYIYVVDANPPAYLLVFNFRHKDCLTYSSGTDRFGELCYNFSISNKLTQIINFPAQIPHGDSHSLSLLDLFLFSGTRADWDGLRDQLL